MDRLWAPWRIKYIRAKRKKKCIFCLAREGGKKHYVIFKTEYSVCMLNIFPYNNGHLLISPLRHLKDFAQLKDVEVLDLFKSLNYAKKILDKTLNPDGYNIGLNVSGHAGAGILGHLHLHIVPRWRGDTNFMPTVYGTKVISQSLDALYASLKKHVKSKTN